MITIKLKDQDEIRLRTMLNLRGVDSFLIDDEAIRDRVLELFDEEIRRHQPRPQQPAKGE